MVYGYKYGSALVMDVYRPKGKPNGAGVIQIVSGAFWSGPEYARIALFAERIQAMADGGYVVFAVMHGSQPKYTLLEIQEDLPRAVRFIRHNSDRFGIEANRIGVTGMSSGGHLALLLGTAARGEDESADDPVDRESSRVQAVVAYCPNSDLLNYGKPNETISEHFASLGMNLDAVFDFHRWDGENRRFVALSDVQCKAVFRAASPLTHVTLDDPPTLLLHGDQDPTVPIQQSQVFAEKMNVVGAECELSVAKGAGHFLPLEKDRLVAWFDQHLKAD